MNDMMMICNLALALSKSREKDITRLDIQYNKKEDMAQAYLYLESSRADYKINGDGTVLRTEEASHSEEPSSQEEPEPDPEPEPAMEIKKPSPPKEKFKVERRPKAAQKIRGRQHKDLHEEIMARVKDKQTITGITNDLGIGRSTVYYHIQKARDEGLFI